MASLAGHVASGDAGMDVMKRLAGACAELIAEELAFSSLQPEAEGVRIPFDNHSTRF